ncbi:MAG: UTP--glucose-1-phosphate uridylyltransferase [Pirellulaceae bacterium]
MDAAKLKVFGQEHVLKFVEELSSVERAELESQLGEVNFEELQQLAGTTTKAVDWSALAAKAEPPPAVKLEKPHPDFPAEKAREVGEAALRAGKVGMILVAGGQGTRLGFDKPKGMFPIGPVSGRTLFQVHCDRLLAVMKRYGVSIPLYVMTSPATDAVTKEYFEANDRCGLSEEQLRVFCQGTMPAVDQATGKLLLATKNSLALSPDGHGGLVAALDKSGCLAAAKEAGIEYFFYGQVDNPLVQSCDPELIGYHILAKSQVTTQVVQKRFAREKVGNVVSIDGSVQIIEYSDLPDSAAEQTNADGSLKLWAGNIAVHVFDREFLESVVGSVSGLPFHLAHKKVPYVDDVGQNVQPESPNAIKFERFVFDLLPLAERAFVVEGDPAKVFAPVKNAPGAEVDTAETSKVAQLAMFKGWLTAAGACIGEGVQVEIHPGWALDSQEVASKVDAGLEFVTDTYLR